MQITEIYYEKVFPIAPYVNEKIGVKLSLSEEERGSLPYDVYASAAMEYAKAMVDSWGYKMIEEQHPESTTTIRNSYGNTAPAASLIPDKKADKEFDDFKAALENIEFREDAEEFLQSSSFKFTVEAKNLVKQKPSKK